MRERFESFADDAPTNAEPPPSEYLTEQLIFEACERDITKLNYVLDNFTRNDLEKWFMHRRYSDYVTRKAYEK